MKKISDNRKFIFSGHENGKVSRYNKDDYISDLFVEFLHVIAKVKVSEYSDDIVISEFDQKF